MVQILFLKRKARTTHPEGKFDKAQRFYPSTREDADGDGRKVRSPSANYPYSYMLRCRTKEPCAVLVDRALRGLDVPKDVSDAVMFVTPLKKHGPTAWDLLLRDEEETGT